MASFTTFEVNRSTKLEKKTPLQRVLVLPSATEQPFVLCFLLGGWERQEGYAAPDYIFLV